MRKVLVVDDEPLILENVCGSLEDAGYLTTGASSFGDAVALFDGTLPAFDCIIVDKNLGNGGSGWDLARIARARYKNVGIIYISGIDARNWASQGVPGSVMLQKPFSGEQIITAVRRLVEPSTPAASSASSSEQRWQHVAVLEEVFEHAPGFMALREGAEPKYAFANKAYRQLVGNRPLIGRSVAEVFPEFRSQGILEILDRVCRTGEPFVAYGMPIEFETSAGRTERKFIDVMYHALTNADGAVVGLLEQGHDVTQERRGQERLEELRRLAVESSRMNTMGTMASAIAHELNQPLTAISNYMWTAKALAKTGDQAEILSQCIDKAGDAAIRSGEIIRKLRTLATKGRAMSSAFDLQKVSQDAIDLATAGVVGISIAYTAAAGIEVLADPVQFQQVLINLIRNSCDAIGPNVGEISIGAAVMGRFAEVCVSDTGGGISAEVLPVIFEAFTTTKPDGMGIGLSICKEIVEAFGGRIEARNLAGHGASICFTLPLAED